MKLFFQCFLLSQIVCKVSQRLHGVSYLLVPFLEVFFLFVQQHSIWYIQFSSSFHFVNKNSWIPFLSATSCTASCLLFKSFKTLSLNSSMYKLISFFTLSTVYFLFCSTAVIRSSITAFTTAPQAVSSPDLLLNVFYFEIFLKELDSINFYASKESL